MIGKRFLGPVLALTLAVSAPFAGAQTVDNDPTIKKDVIERMSRLIERNAYVPNVDFKQWNTFLKEVEADAEKAKSDEEFAGSINAALRKFGFSHIALQTPREGKIFRTGTTVGIGITSQVTEDGVLVVRVVPDAPAFKAGLKPGDLIIEVDGEKPKGIARIIGEEGTQVKLKLKHQDGTTSEKTLTRSKFSTVRPEELVWVDDDTAHLSVYTFATGYNPKRVDELMTKSMKAKNLILDLRDNGGGAVLNLQHLLSYFLPSETAVGTFVNKTMVEAYVKETGKEKPEAKEIAEWSRRSREYFFDQVRPARNRTRQTYNGRLVVLVNPGSGSASEIAAAALRDHANAQVIGQKSAGAVLVSVMVPATHDFLLQYPLSDYITSKGLRLEGNGVVPDVESKEARVRLPGQPDDAIEKARQVFAKMKGGSGIGVQ